MTRGRWRKSSTACRLLSGCLSRIVPLCQQRALPRFGPIIPDLHVYHMLVHFFNGLPKLPRDALGENIKFEGGSAPISMQGAQPCHPAQQDRGEGKRDWTRGEASYGDENTPPHSRSRSADGRSPLCPVDCPLGLSALRSNTQTQSHTTACRVHTQPARVCRNMG